MSHSILEIPDGAGVRLVKTTIDERGQRDNQLEFFGPDPKAVEIFKVRLRNALLIEGVAWRTLN